jgi:hypothetical protein
MLDVYFIFLNFRIIEMNLDLAEETERLTNGSIQQDRKPSQIINDAFPKLLTILILLLLTYGHHLQGNSIKDLSEAFDLRLKTDIFAYQEHLNKTMDGYNLRMRVLEK